MPGDEKQERDAEGSKNNTGISAHVEAVDPAQLPHRTAGQEPAAHPGYRKGGHDIVEVLRHLRERGSIHDTEVEEAEVEANLSVGADQPRLAFKARVRPVLGMETV